ncbi:MAG: lactate racemase domain-containing protein [Thermoleophilaceae bacterium]
MEITSSSPPTVFHSGETFRLERLPVGTRVVYPPPPMRGLADVDAAIAAALDAPFDMDPLDAHLRPGMRLTIAFDDLSVPLPPMRTPDVRQLVIEQVLERAYRAGVDDIHLIAALALHRRMTPAELRRAVGARVFDAFHPDRLYNHDAEDPDGNVELGETDHSEPVTLNRRAAESDLLVYVHVVTASLQGGPKSTAIGLGTYRSISAHHNVHSMRHSRSFIDPPRSELHRSSGRQGDVIEAAVPVFHVEATHNNDMYGDPLRFLAKPEARWTSREQATFAAVKRATDRMPTRARRTAFHRQAAPYAVTSVAAGAIGPVHEVTMARVADQGAVRVQGQADVVTAGLPYVGPYNVNSILNPVLVMCLGLGYFFNLYKGKPLVREGGVLIFTHPVEREFHPVHHPSYIDFYEEVLADTTDIEEIERRHERAYAEDEWYRHLYRTGNAYHGVHPVLHVVLGRPRPPARRRGDLRRRESGGVPADGLPPRGHDARRDRDGRARGRARALDHPLPLPADLLRGGRVRFAEPAPAARRSRFAVAGALRRRRAPPSAAPVAHAARRARPVARGAGRGSRPGVAAPPRAGAGPRRAPAGPALPGHAAVHRPDHRGCRRPGPRPATRGHRPEPRLGRRHPLVLLSLPHSWRSRTLVGAASDRFYRNRFFAVMTGLWINTFPFDRSGDGRGIAAAAELLRDGHNVLLYPQGTRSAGTTEGFRSGVARLCVATGAPLVPVHVSGTALIMPKDRGLSRRGTARVRFGRPLMPGDGEEIEAFLERANEAVAELAGRGRGGRRTLRA